MKNEPTAAEIVASLREVCQIDGEQEIFAADLKGFREHHLDSLVYWSVFHSEIETCRFLRWLIRRLALSSGIVPSSIASFYRLKGQGKFQKITVPAINIRGMTYDSARALMRAALGVNSRAFMAELARSEMGYTHQSPGEFSAVVLGAALREGFMGPVFIQGDHFQFNAKRFASNADEEQDTITALIREAIEAGFYNIDIDASTLVDLNGATLEDQQKLNIDKTVEMTRVIRELEPKGITVSVGGEIGEVGGKNSTVDELRTFLDGYISRLNDDGRKRTGLSKLSVQSGTTHGGVPLPDGSIAEVAIDFDVLKELSKVAMKAYQLGGVVQHGASTLPDEAFEKFPEINTAEIHLATAFQNLIYDGGFLPEDFSKEIVEFCKKNFKDDRKKDDSDEQFIYKTRKKAFGPFKRQMWDLPEEVRKPFRIELRKKFEFLFKQLKAKGTFDGVVDNVETIKTCPPVPEGFASLLTP